MSYTAPDVRALTLERGSMNTKIASELSDIATMLSTNETNIATHKSKFAFLTGHIGTRTALATTGVDIADGAGGTHYSVFFSPVAITLVKMYVLVNEAYVKETTDAKIEIKDNAETPVTVFTKTMTAEGDAEGTMLTATPVTDKEDVDAGTRLNMVVTASASSTGTGHVDIIIEYYEQ